jgi:hypothetical protein
MEVNPSNRRNRLSPWLAVAAVCLGIVGYQLGGSFWGRGLDYYAPRWRVPWLLTDSELERRIEKLSALSVEQSLPVLLAGTETRPSALGQRWEKWRERWSDIFPRWLQRMLPEYVEREALHGWLGEASTNRLVAEAVARKWSKWDPTGRRDFLSFLAGSRSSPDPVLIPTLISAMQESGGPPISWDAAHVVAGFSNRPESVDNSLASFLEQECSRRKAPNIFGAYRRILERLVRIGGVSERLETAIAKGLASPDPRHRFSSAMTLASLFQDRYPTERTLGPILDSRMFSEGWSDIEYFALKSAEFRSVTHSAFFRRRCVDLLGTPESSTSADPVPRRILTVLAQVSAPDSAAALALRPWLTQTDRGLFREAIVAYLASAPPDAAHAEWVIPGLTNQSVCTPVLLWLTEAGTNVIRFAPMVEAFASDALVIRAVTDPGRMEMTPELMQRYGLLFKNGAPPQEARASTLLAVPSSDYPARLMVFWPRSTLRTDSSVGARPKPVPMKTLAERCLRSLRGEPLD